MRLDQAGVSLGWENRQEFWKAFDEYPLAKLAGLILTAIAVSLGAPFWFELVSRLVNLRLTGKPPPRELRRRAGTIDNSY